MDNSFVRPGTSLRHLAVILVVLGCVGLAVSGDNKKTSAPAAKPAAAPAKPASGAAGHAPTSGASHGATTSGTHGPTTSTTHGPTTSSTHGPTTSGTHGPTTSGTHGATTSNHGTTTAKTTTGGASTHGPGTASTGHSSGGLGPRQGGGSSSRPVPATSREVHTAGGNTVVTRSNGHVSDVHDAKRNMDVHNGLNGNRRVSVERADHSRVVAERGGRGYVERGYNYRGHDYGRRTYYAHGRYYNSYYRGYYYRGYYAPVYAPAYYYGPAFYGWAYNPWPAPIAYGWGWGAYPWYGYYGSYFAPYPVYAGAAFWLTDYLIATSLAAEYQQEVDAQIAATALPPGQVVMTPEVKDMISEEVKRQLALENAEAQANAQNQDIDPASSGIGRMLGDNQTHVFIAGSDLDVVQASGQECAISQGDVLEVTSAPPTNANAATATVLCSKGGKECPKSAQVQVPFTDLQEMQNHMRESIDQGMGDLQAKQGQDGLPPAPPSAQTPPVKSSFVAAAPPPEENAAADIKKETQQADQSEQEIAKEVPPPMPGMADGRGAPASSSSTAPVTISQGQTVEDVTGKLGQPKQVIDLGTTKKYVYPDMKITFKNGKVSDVQ